MLKYEGFREDFQLELEYIRKNIIFARFLHAIKNDNIRIR